MFITVVVPCYNEQEVIAETNRRLLVELARYETFEIIYVNDGSLDDTSKLLTQIASCESRVKIVNLSRNFGHQLAVSAGLERASGLVTVIIDADLQDPPDLIHTFVDKWRDGFHVVYGHRIKRFGETYFKRISADLFYRLLSRLSEVEIPRDVGDFRLLDKKVLNALARMPERQRLLRGMVSWVGFRQCGVDYERSPRFAGETKYPLRRMLRLAGDGLLSFSVAPLRMAIWLGLVTAGLSVLGIIYAIALRLLTDIWVEGWTLQLVSTFFLGGVQLISLGVIGEYVGRIFNEVKGRPMYIVADEIGFEAAVGASHPPAHTEQGASASSRFPHLER